MSDVEFVVRGPEPDDLNFILATWIRGLYFGTRFLEEHTYKTTFLKSFEVLVKDILVRENIDIRVCALKEDEDVILGYSVLEGSALHWVFVKESWRKIGIAKRLVPDSITRFTNATDLGLRIKPKKWKFDPFLLLEGDKSGSKKS